MTSNHWRDCPVVERVPGKVGGEWLFLTTRVPVRGGLKILFDQGTPAPLRRAFDDTIALGPGDFQELARLA